MAAKIRLFKTPRGDEHEPGYSHYYGEGGAESLRAEPRVEMFRAILSTAFTDFFGIVNGETDHREILAAKREAAFFLLDPEGTEWGDSRRDICNVLGEYDGDALRLETSRTIIAFEDLFADIGRLAARAQERAERRRTRKRVLHVELVTVMKPEELAVFRARKAAIAREWRAKRRAAETPKQRDERRRKDREAYRARRAVAEQRLDAAE